MNIDKSIQINEEVCPKCGGLLKTIWENVGYPEYSKWEAVGTEPCDCDIENDREDITSEA